MNEAQGTVRMNISVPNDVKREMDATKEAVNWSKVAAEAFRAKLLELKSQRRGATMEDVLNRLRAAAEIEQNETRAAGYKAGETWAKQEAKPSELRRLFAAVYEAPYATGDVGLFVGAMEEGAFGRHVYAAITGDKGANIGDAFGTLAEALEAMQADSDFAVGFVDAATDVWEAVRAQL